MKRKRCGTIVMGHRCTRKEVHLGDCKFKDFTPPSKANAHGLRLADAIEHLHKLQAQNARAQYIYCAVQEVDALAVIVRQHISDYAFIYLLDA